MKRRFAMAVALLLASGCAGAAQLAELPAAAGAPPMPAASYAEPHRPAFHFSPPGGWMNDPNGLLFKDGEWHLFYQYYPHDIVWGPMHWAHAVSRDLVNWQTLPIAIAPDEDGYIFSGSAVADSADSAGFGANALVAIYTIHDPERGRAGTRDHESQGIAISQDNGRSFRRFSGNPVLANPGQTPDFRDPNVFRDDARNQWVMALSVTDHVRFYGSADLQQWTWLSSFGEGHGAHGGVWECPNLFPIRDEASGRTRWVLIQNLNPGGPQGGSGTQYFVGDWDGTSFTPDPAFTAPAWLDHGPDNYAGITWDNAPDGRRVFIGWMSNWLYAQQVPTGVWRSAMTAPRELSLHGLELRQAPVPELARLRQGEAVDQAGALGGLLPLAEYELAVRLPQPGAGFSFTLANAAGERLVLGLAADNRWFIDRRQAGQTDFHESFAAIHHAPRRQTGEIARVRLLIDRASMELFADDGATVMTSTFFPNGDFDRSSINVSGNAELVEARGWRLAPAEFGQ